MRAASMLSMSSHSGEMSQDSARGLVHPSRVQADASDASLEDGAGSTVAAAPRPARPAIDPVARSSKRMYEGLSASSAGLELGIAVGLGAFFGAWLDGKLGTEPWMMLVFLLVGLAAGFRGVLRAVARAERAAARG
jgi:ATP synthase protein I